MSMHLPRRSSLFHLACGSVALAVGSFLASTAALAGDPIGWSDAAQQIVSAGVAAGTALTVLGIVASGAVLWFGLTSLLAITLPMTLGGAVMANAEGIGGTLFNASAGGGLISQTVYMAPAELPPHGR
jgi:type IV secretory pathway VirB2 component (pilin)